MVKRLDLLNEVQDARTALIASVTYNMLRGEGSKSMDVKDFMPDRSGRKRESDMQSPEEMAARMLDIALTFGGEVKHEQIGGDGGDAR